MGATYSTLAGLPVPDTAATNDVPYWLSQLIARLDTQVVLTAATTTDRDSRYFNAPPGVLCVVTTTGGAVLGVYVKTSPAGTATWSSIWEAPSAAVTVTIQLADGFQAANGKTPVAVYNKASNTWAFWGNVSLVNGGNIATNSIVGTLPATVALSTVQPYYEANAPTSVSGAGSPSGAAKISFASGGNIVAYMGSGVQPIWIGFDGIVLPGA